MKRKNRKCNQAGEILRRISEGKSFLVSAHVNPEGDSVGSVFAVQSALSRSGKKAEIVCEDPLPKRFGFLKGRSRWSRTLKSPKKKFDTAIILDCPKLDRIGRVRKLISDVETVINIDHHISNTFYGNLNYVATEASSVGEIIFDLIKKAGLQPTKREAECIYTAIVTDTGSMKFENTKPKTHRILADLLETGLNVEELSEKIFGNNPLKKIKLFERFLKNLRVYPRKKAVFGILKREDYRRSNASREDSEGFIDYIKSLQDMKIAVFLSEADKGRVVKASFRSRGAYDANKLARKFGGGGHKRAAGCSINGNINHAIKLILSEI